MKKRIDIEQLIAWAYREELPKDLPFDPLSLGPLAAKSGWGSIAEYGRLYAKVDLPTNQWGVVADLSARRDPHPDAYRVAKAVEALDEIELVLPDDWAPLSDLGELGEFGSAAIQAAIDWISIVDRDGVRRLKETPRRLVFRQAILGGCPVWECEQPTRQLVRSVNGRPKWFVKKEVWTKTIAGDEVCEIVEVDGYNPTSKRTAPDAYRKEYLDPDPTDAAIARAEYEVWHAALKVLAADLDGELISFKPLAPVRPARPWESSTTSPGVRVWRDMQRALP